MPALVLLLRLSFWCAAAGAYLLAIEPGGSPEIAHWDKMNHMIAFFTIALLLRLGYRAAPTWRLALALAAFGGFIELSQMIPLLHRDASWADWFADIIALLVGMGVANLLLFAFDRLRPAAR